MAIFPKTLFFYYRAVFAQKPLDMAICPKPLFFLLQSSFPFLANVYSSFMKTFIMGNISIREMKCPKDESGSKSSPIHAILTEMETFDFFFEKLMVCGQMCSFAALPLMVPIDDYFTFLIFPDGIVTLQKKIRSAC